MSKKELGAALDDIMSSPTPTAPVGEEGSRKGKVAPPS